MGEAEPVPSPLSPSLPPGHPAIGNDMSMANAAAQGVILSDTLPSFVSGNNLSTTLDLAAGQTVSYTILAVVQAGESYTITNQATVSHTWQQRSSSAKPGASIHRAYSG